MHLGITRNQLGHCGVSVHVALMAHRNKVVEFIVAAKGS